MKPLPEGITKGGTETEKTWTETERTWTETGMDTKTAEISVMTGIADIVGTTEIVETLGTETGVAVREKEVIATEMIATKATGIGTIETKVTETETKVTETEIGMIEIEATETVLTRTEALGVIETEVTEIGMAEAEVNDKLKCTITNQPPLPSPDLTC